MEKKRHHYVPEAYLKAFCDDAGRVYEYRKDAPESVLHHSPENTGVRRYYYSQPLPGGGTDNNTLEDFFCDVEGKWPPLVAAFREEEDVNNRLDDIFAFIGLQRARVPASRDANERMLAERVKADVQLLDEAGELPPKPKELEDVFDKLQVAIDPHQSIHGMVEMIQGTGTLLSLIGLGVLKNETDVPFLTSDNPVMWFDPSVAASDLRPYNVRPDGPILFLFPVAPDLCICGDNVMREQFAREGIRYGTLNKPESVVDVNRQVCRFAYESVFAQRPGQEALVREHAALSPVLETQTVTIDGKRALAFRTVFGQRSRKPKWKG